MIISTLNLMLVALGFLSAVLIAFFIIPLVWRWAVRMTTWRMQRVQSQALPGQNGSGTNTSEARTEHLQNTRKVEKRLLELKQKLAAQAVETARHSAAVAELEATIAEKDRELALRNAEIQKRIDAVIPLEAEMKERTDAAQRLRDQLQESNEARQALQGSLLEAEKSIALRDEKIEQLKETVRAHELRIAPLEQQNAEGGRVIFEKEAALEELNALVADQKDKLLLQQARLDEIDQILAHKDAEIERQADTAQAQLETLQSQRQTAQNAKDVTALANAVIDKLQVTNTANEVDLKQRVRAIAEAEKTVGVQVKEIARLTAVIETREKQLASQADSILAVNASAAQKDNENKRLQADLKAHLANIQESDKVVLSVSETVKLKDAEIAELREAAKSQDNRFTHLAKDLETTREELAGRVVEVEGLTSELNQRGSAVDDRDATLGVLKDELASLTARSAEEAELFKAQLQALESEKLRLVAELQQAGQETGKLLHEFDELDQLWDSQVGNTVEPEAPGKNAVAQADPAPRAKVDDKQPQASSLTDRFRALQSKID